jgi:hypothetical protein
MHEHHEQEMTPSALSYQLRDTIPASAGIGVVAVSAAEFAACGLGRIPRTEIPSSFGTEDNPRKIGATAIHAVRTISRGRPGTADWSVAAATKNATEATAVARNTKRDAFFIVFIARFPGGEEASQIMLVDEPSERTKK